MGQKNYDVAVSYASEQRPYVERFVKQLQSRKLNVYYDREAQPRMVGKVLDQELHKIYINESEHCILFLSDAYISKPVTRFESGIILSETLFKDGFMYILKFDDVSLPGLNRNFTYSNVTDFPEPEQYADFIYEVIRGEKPQSISYAVLYEILAEEIKQMLEHHASQYGLELMIDQQTNKLLLRLQSNLSVLLQLQVAKLPGKPGVCLWLHRGRHSCDEHAYQGYVQWSAKDCRYILENHGILLDLMPVLEFPSTGELLRKLKTQIQELLGG